MARIYKRTDRIKVKIDDVVVTIAPLSLDQKTEAQMMMAKGKINRDFKVMQDGVVYLLKHGLKNIEGIVDQDGNKYELTFKDGVLTDECVDELFNIEMHKKLVMVCSALVGVIPDAFTDNEGNKLEGVEIIPNKTEEAPSPN